MVTKTYPKHFKCTLCDREITLYEKWEGRSAGPQCPCNPNTWGNWKRIESRTTNIPQI